MCLLQEYVLAHTEMPTTLEGAEAAIKKQEDFMTTMDANEDKINGVVEAGRRLSSDGNINSERIQERVASIEGRYVAWTWTFWTRRTAGSSEGLLLCFRQRRNRESAVELLMKLKDNRDLQKFLQDCQEVSSWSGSR